MQSYEKALIEALCSINSSEKETLLKYIFTIQYLNNTNTPNSK